MIRCWLIRYRLALVCLLLISTTYQQVSAQDRLRVPPTRILEGTLPLPAGTNRIPRGYRLKIVMETPISSNRSQVSDRFVARVAIPVVDENGRTLISANSTIEGHVTAVKPAKWAKRSGSLSITIDKLRMSEGSKVYTLRAFLAPAREEDFKKFDNEGSLKAGSTAGRDIAIVGGGTGAGAAIGAVAGGAVLGLGIGAAAGVTTMLLMKGKDAVVNPGDRFDLEVAQDLRLTTSSTDGRPTLGTQSRSSSTTSALPDDFLKTTAGPVDINDVRAERTSDGLLRILITAETPTSGWRIFTNHVVSGSTAEVRLRGVPSKTSAPKELSHPAAPVITIQDRNRAIQTVVVNAKNGSRTVPVTDAGTSSKSTSTGTSGSTTTSATKPKPSVSTSSSSGSSSSSASSLGARCVSEIEQIRYDYGATVGVWINQDGTYDVIGQRKPTSDEKKLLDGLGALLNSVKEFNSASGSSAQQSSASRVAEDANDVEQYWKKVKMSSDLNQKFSTMLKDVRTLIGGVQTPSQPSGGTTTTTPPPSTGSSSTSNPPTSSGSSTSSSSALSSDITKVTGEIQQCQFEYGATLGVWIDPDGTYSVMSGQPPLNADQKQIMDGLTSMLKSVKSLGTASSASQRKGFADQIKRYADSVEQAWKRVKMSDSLNQKFGTMLKDARALADKASK